MWLLLLGQFATEEAIANLREEYGLNNPFYVQYLDWAVNFVKGDWAIPCQPNANISNSDVQVAQFSHVSTCGSDDYVPLGILLGFGSFKTGQIA